MKSTKAAGRYAQSLLDLSVESGELESVKADMELIRNTIEGSYDLELMLESPVIKPDAKQAVLNNLFSTRISKLSLRFVLLITAKGRESILGPISQAFLDQYRAHKGIVIARVVSASALTTDAKKALITNLSLSGNTIELIEKIDPSLLGGLRVKVGDQLIDASIRRKLNDLKSDISKNKLSAI